jgi:hypothetical protein
LADQVQLRLLLLKHVQVMQSDVQVCHDLGAAGVVIGALSADGTIDEATTCALLQQARTLVRRWWWRWSVPVQHLLSPAFHTRQLSSARTHGDSMCLKTTGLQP